MIGFGPFQCLSRRLDHPSVPSGRAAQRFSDALRRACGAMLAWNARRRVFCVVRCSGDHMPLTSFFDIARSDLPFNGGLLRKTANAVKYYLARASGNRIRMLRQIQALQRDEWEKARDGFMADYVPEFIRNIRRAHEIVTDGRYRPKFFDTAGKPATTASAP